MIKVLIVDDEQAMVEGLKNFINWEELGVDQVFAATDPFEALKLAETERPNIVISDIKMPKMDGIDLSRRIRQKLPDVYLLFLTAYSEKEYLKSAIVLGAVNYLEKPVNRKELSEVVRELTLKIQEQQATVQCPNENIVLDLIYPNKKAEPGNIIINSFQRLTCIYIKIQTEDSVFSALRLEMKEKLLISVEKLLSQQIEKALVAMKNVDGLVGILLSERDLTKSFFEEKIPLMKDIISVYYNSPLRLFIGIGCPVRTVEEIPCSYQEAVINCQQYFFAGYDHVCGPSSVPESSNDLESIFKKFDAEIQSHNKEQIRQTIIRIGDDLKRSRGLTISAVKNLFFQMMLRLIKDGSIPELNSFDEDLWKDIESIDTLDLLIQHLLKKLDQFVIQYPDADIVEDNLQRIRACIEENYSNPDFCLEKLAKMVYLSPQYICRIFKKSMGETVNQYLVHTRIEKAKQLLHDSSMKLSAVAQAVGYSSPNHFSKIFRNQEGMNPSEYQRRIRHNRP